MFLEATDLVRCRATEWFDLGLEPVQSLGPGPETALPGIGTSIGFRGSMALAPVDVIDGGPEKPPSLGAQKLAGSARIC